MSSFRRCRFGLLARSLPIFFLLLMANIAGAQGVPARGGLDLAPTNPFGMPGTTAGLPQGSNSLYLNSGMFCDILPRISNLEIGYLYQFGNVISTGRLTFDYVLPAYPSYDSAAFGEAHAEFTNFGKTLQRIFSSGNATTTERGYRDRIDLSFGGGYRKIFGDNLLLGVNAFADTTKLADQWYGSGGLGFEMATLGAGNDLVELIFNYYGDIFQGRNSIINAFRNGPSNFDVSARYSIELGDHGPDFRIKATGYQFDIGAKQYGWNTEAEVRTRNGMFSVKAGTGHDPVNGWYHTIGGFVNVGLDFANLLNGESPFEMPEPIFRSPRNLRRLLAQKVDRSYLSPPGTVARLGGGSGGSGSCILKGNVFFDLTVVNGPASVSPGATCVDIPDYYYINPPTGTIGVDYSVVRSAGSRGELYIIYHPNDGCSGGTVGASLLDGCSENCYHNITYAPWNGPNPVGSVQLNCANATGCDAGLLRMRWSSHAPSGTPDYTCTP
jgi:hypothetical protein